MAASRRVKTLIANVGNYVLVPTEAQTSGNLSRKIKRSTGIEFAERTEVAEELPSVVFRKGPGP